MNDTTLLVNQSLQEVTASAFTYDWASIIALLKPLIFFIIGISIYSFFVFKFYHFLGKKDLLGQHWHRSYDWNDGFFTRLLKSMFYLVEYILAIPLLLSFFFIFLAAFILLLSNSPPHQILLMVMAIIGSIRIAAYYRANLSNDLAKMIPFALLGVFILDPTFLSMQSLLVSAKDFIHVFDMFFYYLIFLMALEFFLRIVSAMFPSRHVEDSN